MSSASTNSASLDSGSSSDIGSAAAGVIEDKLRLADGRVLQYAVGGDLRSRRIFLSLHGVFGIGAIAAYQSRLYAKRGWMCLAPTLPGWGESSPFPLSTPISAYVSDIRQLVDSVLTKYAAASSATHIVVFGGSYGSVWAYAVAANCPPATAALRLDHSSIRGLVIMGGFSPFLHHSNYGQGMRWMNYLTVGRLGLYPPFNWMHSMIGNVIRKQVANNVEGSLKMLRQILTGEKAMTAEDRQLITRWAENNGSSFAEWELSMAQNMSRSVANTMDGYSRVCQTLNADWGFRLEEIRVGTSAASTESASVKPVLRLSAEQPIPSVLPAIVLCGGLQDNLAHIEMLRWVNSKIPSSQLLELQGGHIGGITSLNSIIEAVINGIERDDDSAKSK